MGMVSKEYADQENGGTATLDYYVGLKNAENMSEEEATNYANELAKSLISLTNRLLCALTIL